MDFGIGSVVAITVITYLIGMGCKSWSSPWRSRYADHGRLPCKGYFKRLSRGDCIRSSLYRRKSDWEAAFRQISILEKQNRCLHEQACFPMIYIS